MRLLIKQGKDVGLEIQGIKCLNYGSLEKLRLGMKAGWLA